MKKANILLAVLSVCLAAGFGSAPANADNDDNSYGWQIHGGGACTGINRIDKTSSSCLEAGWDNEPQYHAGTVYWAKNLCNNLGKLVVHIDLYNLGDRHFHLHKYYSGKITRSHSWTDTRNIYCCLDKSDLCWKRQVQARNGTIWHIDTSRGHTNPDYIDVTTHQKRYNFCKDNSDYIYCRVDPKGDANKKPKGPACADDNSCNCGDHYCTAEDCDAEWDLSAPGQTDITGNHGCLDSSHSEYASSIDADDGTSQTCTITTACNHWVTYDGKVNAKKLSFSADVEDIRDHYACNGELKEGGCFSGTVVSTFIEDIQLPAPD